MRKIAAILLFTTLLVTTAVFAQEQEEPARGQVNGEWRTFYLHTFNKRDLRNFYALGTGGQVGYTYTFNSHWQAGARLYTTWNTNLQDLTIPDQTTGQLSRYEIGLFDLTDPENRFFVLPGELYITYTGGPHKITAGRMKQATPLVNPQDGRMIPTLVEGLWYGYNPGKSLHLKAGLITRISPRGTDHFSRVGQSIGKYSTGRDLAGRPSGYAGNTSSDFLFIASARIKLHPSLVLQAWNYYTENVFNTTYLRPELTLPGSQITLGLEWAHQRRVGEGGNAADSLRYFQDQYSNLLGAQLSVQATDKCRVTLGYDYITDDGRFLFPREWGREGTYTFQKRERSEGSRKNHALLLSLNRSFNGEHSSLESVLSVGHQWKPAPSDALRNKYAMPGYTHINLDLTGRSELVKNLVPELLLTYKIGRDDYPENPSYILNKVDMFQVNVVLNYQF